MNYLLIFPEIILGLFGLLTPIIDLFIAKEKKSILHYWTLVGLLLSLSALLKVLNVRGTIWNGILVIDPFSHFFKIIFLIVALLVTLASIVYMEKHEDLGEYYTLILFATLGMMFVASSGELITLYISLELATVSTYALVGFFKKDPNSSEAAIKYFIISALSSALIVFGMSFIYGATGSTKIYVISGILKDLIGQKALEPILILGAVLLIAGFGFEIAAVPFHMWLPDAYEGAPTTITAFMATALEAMGFAAVFRIFGVSMTAMQSRWGFIFAILAFMTMVWGNLVPLVQRSVKRLLAYSCIGHAGYILIGVAVVSPLGIAGGLLHLLVYVFMKGSAFIAVAMLSHTLALRDIEDYRGLRDSAPITAFCLTIFLLSLAGIPPLGGFVSKFVIFSAAIEGGMAWLAVVGVITSAISLYYYAKIIKEMYIVRSGKSEKIIEPKPILLVLVVSLIALFLIGLYPDPFIAFAMKAGNGLLSF
ncbi:MAG: NADH-quinone oxidoreductase subunit N [Candidatus Hydrothermarchaeales archaeon]